MTMGGMVVPRSQSGREEAERWRVGGDGGGWRASHAAAITAVIYTLRSNRKKSAEWVAVEPRSEQNLHLH